MKNLFKTTVLASAATLLAFSCQEAEVMPNPANDGAVSFTSKISNTTKATDVSFEVDDQISVTAFGADGAVYADNYTYTYDATGSFTSTNPILGGDELSYTAIYPVQSAFANAFAFDVLEDQATENNYTLSDLMIAEGEATTSLTPALTFYHSLSRLNVEVTADIDLTGAVVKVLNVAKTANVDIEAGTVAASGDVTSVVMAGNVDEGYKAILVPQSIDDATDFVAVEVNGKVYTAPVVADATMEAGKQYFFAVTIEADKITVTSSITPWEEGDLYEEDEPAAEPFETTLAKIPTDGSLIPSDTWIITDVEIPTQIADPYDTSKRLGQALKTAGRLISLEFPNATSFGYGTFYGAKNLYSVKAPIVTDIPDDCFYSIDDIVNIEIPAATTVGGYGVGSTPKLETLTLCLESKNKGITYYSLNNCYPSQVTLTTGVDNITGAKTDGNTWWPIPSDQGDYLEFKEIILVGDPNAGGDEPTYDGPTFYSVDFQNMFWDGVDPATIEGDTWYILNESIDSAEGTPQLVQFIETAAEGREISLVFPNATSVVGSNAFEDPSGNPSTKLVSISAPKLTNLGMYTFSGISGLRTISLPSLISTSYASFSKCTGLQELTLSVNSYISSYNASTFDQTPLTSVTLNTGASSVTGAMVSGNNWNVISGGNFVTFTFGAINIVTE